MDRLVLVTGGTGYVGSVLVPEIAKKYPVRVLCSMHFGNPILGTPNVEFLKGDIRNDAIVTEALYGVTDVIHLAGIVTSELAEMNPAMTRQINVEAMDRLCNLSTFSGVQRFIYASSSGIYGTQPLEATEESEPQPQDEYMRTKLEGERVLNGYSDNYVTCSIRMASLCGPAPRMRLDTIVNIFSAQAYWKGLITVWDGRQWRTNLHCKDAADFYVLLLDTPKDKIHKQVFNLTVGNAQATALAFTVSRIIPCKIDIDTTKIDNRHYRMSGEKVKRILGWQPKKTVEDAIRDNVDWFTSGNVKDPDDAIYHNTRRMRGLMS